MRDWEKWWRDHAPLDFLRWEKRTPMFEMVAEIASEVGGSVLDVGCASCIPYPYFKKRGIKYTGLDLTKKFLDHAKELYPEINLHHGNIIDSPFPNCSFDTVLCINTFVNFNPDEYQEILNRIIRIAKKQVVIVFEKEPWIKPMQIKKGELFYTVRYNKDELMKTIKNNSKVKDLEIIILENGEYMRSEAIYLIKLF